MTRTKQGRRTRSHDHKVSARRRVNTCGVLGLAAGLATALFAPWQLAVLVGWDILTVTLLLWIWSEVGRCDANGTRELSIVEDNTRGDAVVIMVAASTFSLAGVAFGLVKAHQVQQPLEAILTVAAVLAVVHSWCVVHIMFTLHYAHLYYSEPAGGIDFPGDEVPDYRDFAYLAFTVGVAFALSDTPVSKRSIRRSLTSHALVSYLFGAVIIALAINVVAGFIR